MIKDQVKEIIDRISNWPAEDQEKLARFIDEVERRNADDDITDEEWGGNPAALQAVGLGRR